MELAIVNNIIPMTIFCLSLFCAALILYIAFAIKKKNDASFNQINEPGKAAPMTMRIKLYIMTSLMMMLASLFIRLIPAFYGVLPVSLVKILQGFPYLWDIIAILMWGIAIAILIFKVPKRKRRW